MRLVPALTISIAAHVAAIVFWQTAQPSPAPRVHRSLTVSLTPGMGASPKARSSVAATRVRAASRAAMPKGDVVGDALPIPSEPEAAPTEGKVAGIALPTTDFGPFPGGMRRRAFNVPVADATMQASQDLALGRRTQTVHAFEDALVGRWIASLVERLRDAGVRRGRCELRSIDASLSPTCDASDARDDWTPVLEAPEALALLERFGCVAFERTDALASVGPCR